MTENVQKELDSFIVMSRKIGSQYDQIQAGGGNTSLKFSDGTMAVKSSGSLLRNMAVNSGYVVLPFEKVVNVFASASRDPKDEKAVSGAVNELVITADGAKPQRPSVEAGFHATLGKCVIHTHCVYANYFNCINGGKELLDKIFADAKLAYVYYPFINPGAPLTFRIMDDANTYKAQGKAFPNIIFLENHGLIVWHDDVAQCEALYGKVNDLLKAAIYTDASILQYPAFSVPEQQSDYCVSVNGFLKNCIRDGIASKENIAKNMLSPDQLVYLNSAIEGEGAKLQFANGTVEYRCSLSEATALEETLLAFIYLLYLVNRQKKTLHNMPDSGIAFILGWDAEKYRKTQIQLG